MEGSKSKAEVIKPVILQVGIPLVISVAGFICAKIIAARRKPGESIRSLESESCDEEEMSLDAQDRLRLQEEILGLGRMLESLQEREWKLEMQFLRYCELRDREALLLEIKTSLELELGRVEALSREVVSMDREHKRLAEIALEYVKVLEEMRSLRSENGAMQRKVKKLLRKARRQSDFIRDSNLRIKAQEREISSTRLLLESERDAVKKMEGEVREMRRVMKRLQQEKDELRIGLSSVEGSVLKMRQEGASMEDLKQLLKELEQLQEEQAAEEKELIYLRWSNACLRHEMMRKRMVRPDDHDNHNRETTEAGSSELEAAAEVDGGSRDHNSDQEGPSPRTKTASDHFWKRKKLLQRLRRWVDGNGREHSQPKVRPADAEEHRIV